MADRNGVDMADATAKPAKPAKLTKAQARKLTDEIKADATALWKKIVAAYERRADVALGYQS